MRVCVGCGVFECVCTYACVEGVYIDVCAYADKCLCVYLTLVHSCTSYIYIYYRYILYYANILWLYYNIKFYASKTVCMYAQMHIQTYPIYDIYK